MICIILAGGSGTRLFPISRKNYPKQFIPFFDGRSLFEMTIDRFDEDDEIFIVANQSSLSYFNQMKSLINRPITLILEPQARNTSVAIIYSLLIIEEFKSKFSNLQSIGVFPADHLIENLQGFRSTIKQASNFVEDSICLIGIEPTRPETGYGYIEYKDNDVLSFKEKPSFRLANEYIKKGGFLWNAGMFLFNNDIFWENLSKSNPQIFKLAINLKEIITKEQVKFSSKMGETYNKINIVKPSRGIDLVYNQFPNISIDYALIEKTKDLKVIKANFDWDDLGNLQSLAKKVNRSICMDWGKYIFTKDEIDKRKNFENENIFSYDNNFHQNTNSFEQNILKSNNDKVDTLSNSMIKGISSSKSIKLDSNNVNKHEDDTKDRNLVYGLPDKKYAFIDIDDLILFDTKDVLLLIKKREKDSSNQNISANDQLEQSQTKQAFKEQILARQARAYLDQEEDSTKNKKPEPIIEFFDHIKKTCPEVAESHKIVSRPWGFFDQLFEHKNRFQIKIININAGESLSLQYHNYRDEEWIILSGSGKIRIEDQIFEATISDHFSIKKMEKHQVIAKDKGITILEVQFGEILNEDDIVRLEDKYERS